MAPDRSPTEILDALYDAIVAGEAETTAQATRDGLEAGIDPTGLMFDSMIPALEEIGRQFESGQIFLPEMLISARAMQSGMDLIEPRLAESSDTTIGTFVMGTVAGDIHDIGKNLCNVMLRGAGFNVVDLGVNVPAERFVAAIDEHQPDAVGISAFLTTTMPEIATTIDTITDAGRRGAARIIIGGAPINQEFADSVGADGYAPNAVAAVRTTKQLLGL